MKNNIFCNVCGRILTITEKVGKCACGFEKTFSEEIFSTEEIKQKSQKGEGFVKEQNILATFAHECKKCGHDKAQVIEMGVWYSDEAGVIRYKCGKCGFTEQDKGSNT
jgi:DNA-directed RNA polymerase subunit M